jgi:hypothetical protein
MAGMKISVDSAMRTRDVSQPTAADEEAARTAEAAAVAATTGRRPPRSGHMPANAVSATAEGKEENPALASPRPGPRPALPGTLPGAELTSTGRRRPRRRRRG